MQRSWESGTGGPGPEIEKVGGGFLSWEAGTGGPGTEIEMSGGGFLSGPRPCMGCSAWE